MASSPTVDQITSGGHYLIYVVVGLVVQTFFFGIYTVLMVLSTRMLMKRGLKTRAHKVTFAMTIFMYFLSAAYWIYSIADVVDRMKVYISDLLNPVNFSAGHDTVTKWSPLFNALVLVNYIISDSVVVWRAWILSLRNYRKYLAVTMFFLVVTTVSVTCTIIFRIIAVVQFPWVKLPSSSYLIQGINILQMSNLGMSLLSNLSATIVVGATLFHHRQRIRAAFSDNKKSTKADQILTLLVESGVLYSISGVIVLVASVIKLPEGTLGDLYTPVHTQIAGAYPSVVLLLVSMQRSLNETTFLNTFEASAPSRPIEFRTGDANPAGRSRAAPALSIQFARNPQLSGISGTELGSQIEAVYDNSAEAEKP
ncbi:hypothetical protein B0H17DRAFT_1059787 [Mycena rosella]|uniref:Uncharacterized protein n=1 Tax=Mycena rosella TaxID=1033263 RepID=A0AAD7DKE5_MYCRO|nr:hypothetical protein B0H17DRAFT_1059787 [Mycena rosella]